MDHGYVDQYAVAQRYLDHALSPKERAAFEAHLVDCQECTDRLLLAEMFHARQPNGVAAHPHLGSQVAPQSSPQSSLVLRLKPRQVALLAIIALLAVAIPAFVILAFLH
jgi:anti-sigma factor RsiW